MAGVNLSRLCHKGIELSVIDYFRAAQIFYKYFFLTMHNHLSHKNRGSHRMNSMIRLHGFFGKLLVVDEPATFKTNGHERAVAINVPKTGTSTTRHQLY